MKIAERTMTSRWIYVPIIGLLKGEEKKGEVIFFKKKIIMTENFPSLGKKTDIQI